MPAIGDMPYQQLIRQLQSMCEELTLYPRDIEVNAALDEFWYQQKIVELKTLREQFQQTTLRMIELRKLMDGHYLATRKRYRHDLRWLRRNRKSPGAIISQESHAEQL